MRVSTFPGFDALDGVITQQRDKNDKHGVNFLDMDQHIRQHLGDSMLECPLKF